MDYIFYQVAAVNGFDAFGHYLRAGLIVNPARPTRSSRSPRLLGQLPPGARRASAAPAGDRGRPRDPIARSARAAAAPATRRGDAERKKKQATRATTTPRAPGRAPPSSAPGADAGRRDAAAGPRRPTAAPAATPQPGDGRRRPLLDYLFGERRMSRRGAAASPATRPDRRRHGARRDRRRLPGLQRQRGPAVRADLHAQGRASRRRQPGARQRGAHRRRARRRGRRDHAERARRRHERRGARRSSSRRTSSRCRRTPRCSSARAPRSASSTSRSRAGTSTRGLRRRRHDPARRGARRRRSSSTSSSTCSTSTTRTASQTNLTGFGDAFAGRGARSTRRSARCAPLLRDIVPVAQNLADPDTGLRRFFARARARRRDRRAGRRGAGRAVREPRHARSRRSRAVARPFIQDSISGGPPTLDAAISDVPRSSGRSWPTPRACSASCGPGVAALRTAAPGPRRRARGRHADAAGRRVQPRLADAVPDAPGRSPRTRWCRSASGGLTETVRTR